MAIRSSVPEQCHLKRDGDPSKDQLRRDLEVIETYVDESHLMRRLEKCRMCGQLYFYEFKEEIDWVGGNDPQYLTWIPVDDPESAKELSRLNYLEILQFPSIRCDFPFDAQAPSDPKWWVGTT
jgi:hypothetical protein